jgi:ABC-2 type transport system permease protein
VGYTSFLIPGLVMMQVLQNAFANSSSSLIQAKITGSIVFVLLPPIPYSAFLPPMCWPPCCGPDGWLGVLLATVWFVDLKVVAPVWILVFSLLGGGLFGALGMIAGIWSEKFDQLASFQNFLIMPLTMLSGVFYSIYTLPAFWQGVSHYNPVFYMIDGFRYGFFGVSDVAPEQSLMVVVACFAVVSWGTLNLLKRGWKLRA